MNLLKKALTKFESPVPGSDSSHWKLSLWLHYSYNFLVVLIGGGVTFYGCRIKAIKYIRFITRFV